MLGNDGERRSAQEADPSSPPKLLRPKIYLMTWTCISNNRSRIQEIFRRIDAVNKNEEVVWKILLQFEELKNSENTAIEENW